MMGTFEEWTNTCVDKDSTVALTDLYEKAKDHFKTKISTDSEKSKSTCSDLALLISTMERPLSSKSNDQKVKALNYLFGSLDGIYMAGLGIPLPMVQSMGRFLTEHCRPIHLDQSSIVFPNSGSIIETAAMGDKYNSEDVRDVALSCISSLIKYPITVPDDGIKDEVICARIVMMQDAIRGRCASVEDDDEDDYEDELYDDDQRHGQGHAEETKTLSGLSLLPRAKRSLCFEVLENTLEGIAKDIEHHSQTKIVFESKTIDRLINFVNFTSMCLHGESDPRCLIQMLEILKEIQSVLLPTCFSSKSTDSIFPFLSIFDAVAAYYPIRFTPPKNDHWGITRDGLRDSLMNIFTCHIHDDRVFIDHSLYESENMIALTVQLFLERLSPQTEYGEEEDNSDVTTIDRIEALEDLSELIVMPYKSFHNCDDWTDKRNKRQQKVFGSLSIKSVKELSSVLLRTHEDAAIAVASSSKKEEEDVNKQLADLCRTIVNNLAYEFEVQSKAQCDENSRKLFKSFWSCFVSDQIDDLCSLMSSSPQSMKGRVVIAYVASLSACGGEQTLRLCLEKCVPIFLEFLKKFQGNNIDEEQVAIAAYGVGLFFSSSRVSMEKITEQNVVVHPHPLQDYVSQCIQTLSKIIKVNDFIGVKVNSAAIKALESVLMSSPSYLFEDVIAIEVRQLVEYVGQHLIDTFDTKTSKDDDESSECHFAHARFIGAAIGTSLKQDEMILKQEDPFLRKDKEVETYIKKNLLPRILQSSLKSSKCGDYARIDWKILAFGCQEGDMYVSDLILVVLFQSLKERIQSKNLNEIKIAAGTISYLFHKGGPNPVQSTKAKRLHSELIHSFTGHTQSNRDNDIEMSSLMLPDVRKEKRTEADCAMEMAKVVLPSLFVAYENGTFDELCALMSRVSQLLPPLSEMDQTRLSIILPILAILLSTDVSIETDLFAPILPNLVEYLLAKDNRHIARVAASTCIFSLVAKQLKDEDHNIIEKILVDTIVPFLQNKVESIDNETSSVAHLELQDTINVLALIGSSLIFYVGHMASIVDEIAKFLTSIACKGIVHSSFLGIQLPYDLKTIHDNLDDISFAAANGLGLILSLDNPTKTNKFWKQRILHKVYPLIDSTKTSNMECSRLLCVCHLISCIPLSAFGADRLSNLTGIILDGFKDILKVKENTNAVNSTDIKRDLVAISLSSLLKIINFAPELINRHFRTIVPMALIFLTSVDDKGDVPAILVALQILTDIIHLKFTNRGLACELYKDSILSIVANLLDHRSFQIRRAAALTRNKWYIVG